MREPRRRDVNVRGRIEELAQREGTSINKTTKKLLRKALGIENESVAERRKRFEKFLGTWTFVPEEIGDSFDLESILEVGALPIIWAADHPADALDAYVRMYLKEEIQAEAITRNLAGFARFLPIAALFHAQPLNVSSLARDAGVARTTVQGYLQILEDTLFTFRVPAFAARLRVRERRHPKLYWIDPGLVRAVRGDRGSPDAESRGALFEGWIAQLLRAYQDYRGICDEIAYWAPAEATETEVDFVLRRGRQIVAIEAKASRRWKPEFAKGLRAIAELPAVTRRIVVYLGNQTLRIDGGIEVLPLARFVEELEGRLD